MAPSIELPPFFVLAVTAQPAVLSMTNFGKATVRCVG